MDWVFYIAGGVALVGALLTVSARNAVHAALYLVVSLMGVALSFFSLGAAFAAALEIIVYAGAIMVMVLFVIMLLNLGAEAERTERSLLRPRVWVGPALLALLLGTALVWLLISGTGPRGGGPGVGVEAIGASLFGPYVLAVELASLLLLAGLVGATHLTRRGRGQDEPGEEP